MPLAEDLLAQALLLVNKEPKKPKDASLRRAVSTAYYALFHLLIQEACAKWSHVGSRQYLARSFEHKVMKDACTAAENASHPPTVPTATITKLRSVARAFRELQQARHLADYSYATQWDRVKALAKVTQAQTAFTDWKAIRSDDLAQRYLATLLSRYNEW